MSLYITKDDIIIAKNYLTEKELNVLQNNRRPILEDNGTVTHQQAREKAENEYTLYRRREMQKLESDYDRAIRQLTLFGNTNRITGEE